MEQDYLGMTLYNLAAAGHLCGLTPIPTASAKNCLQLVQQSRSILECRRLVKSDLDTPRTA